ncbi:MAG: 50S ribosomal protein L13 [Chloroflexi bacterium]|nr:50S ribosomal protein L13 [Chloroflexota bacterium]
MTINTKPYRTRASDLNPLWHVIDADGKTLGRLSSEIAVLLQGKHKPMYVPYLNTGDFVVVINAEKVRVTGKKLEQKMYYRHSGYPGGLKEQTLSSLMDKSPTRALKHAVKGMLPKNAMGRRMFGCLKVYAGDAHPHEAQVIASERAKAAETAETAAEPEEPAPPKRATARTTKRKSE